jgi:hypothetical protein
MKTEEEGLNQQLLNSTSRSKRSLLSQRSDSSQEAAGVTLPGFAAQSRLLIYKNVVLTFRNPKNLIFLIITPFLLSLFLFVFQGLARENGQRTLVNTQEYPLSGMPKCYGEDCVSLHYRIIANAYDSKAPWAEYTIDYIKLEEGFSDNDVTTGKHIISFEDLNEYYEESKRNLNKTQIAVFFCSEGSKDFFLEQFYCNGTKDFTYFLVLNKTDSLSVVFHDYLEPLPIDIVASNLKVNSY